MSTRPRPRLLILTPDYPPARGGIQEVTEQLARSMQGLESRIVTLSSPGADEHDRATALTVERVGAGRAPHSGRVALLNARAISAALRFRPELVLSMHVVTSPAAAAVRRALGAPVAQYFHAEEIGVRPRLAAFAADHADVSIAVSRYTAELVRATGARPRSLDVIGNGVHLPAPDQIEPLATARPTFVTVARIQERYKGHDVLARALPLVRAEVPEVEWVVLGDGDLREGIEALVSSAGASGAASFMGVVSDEERNLWLRRAQLLAMPSRLPGGGFAGEGFGIAYMEAAAHATPSVAGAVGGALDAVEDGVTGLLVDPVDPLALAQAISRLLLDPELARRLGHAGRLRAERYAWPIVAGRVQALLLGLLEQSARAAVAGPPAGGP